MDVKPGYKQTDVGVIPEDWQVVKLGHHATFRTGPFGSALHKSDYVYGGIPIVNPMQIIDGKLVATPRMTISEAAAHRLSEFRLCAGEVVIGRRGDMGRCAVVEPESDGWLCGTGSMIVRPMASLDGRFAQRVLSDARTVAAIEAASVGTTMVNLNQGTLSNLLIPLPSRRAEQADISQALSDADALIGSLEQLLAKKRQIKQGAMQALLTGKQRLPGFSGEWGIRRIAEFAQVKTGPFGSTLHESDYVQVGTPIITVEHLGEFGVTRQNLPLVSDDDRKRLQAYSLEVGDIVFSRVGSVDRNALIREDESGWLFSGRLLRVRPDRTKAFPPFVSYQFHTEHFCNSVLAVAVGQTMASLNTKILNNLTVALPPIPEQTAIATVLSDMDTELAALDAHLAKARQLKQGMMQVLLIGRIRLV